MTNPIKSSDPTSLHLTIDAQDVPEFDPSNALSSLAEMEKKSLPVDSTLKTLVTEDEKDE